MIRWRVGVLGILVSIALAASGSPAPSFSEADIRASRIVLYAPGSLPEKPADIFTGVDMLNLFIVVEAGAHHIAVFDGDKFESVHRFKCRDALQGEPQFTPDGRYVYVASRDGWITKFDIWNLKTITEIRAGTVTRNVAISSDGKFLAVANELPHTLVLLDAELQLLMVHAAKSMDGKMRSGVSAVYDAAPRRSFVAALENVPEIWEISYNPAAEELPVGMIHDFRYREGAFVPGFLNPRRTSLSEPIGDFILTRDTNELLGARRGAGKAPVVNLDVRRVIAELNLPGQPHPGAGATWQWQGKSVMAVPDFKDGPISLIDVANWKPIMSMPTGPGLFVRSHEKTPYAWAGSVMRQSTGTLLVFDKRSQSPVTEITVSPGKTLAQVEFSRDATYALASLAERNNDGGALVVFDAATFKEIKRISMDKPTGAYNVFNSIRRSLVTLH